MSVPKKHHYLPQFFMQRWADSDGEVAEYRRPHTALVVKRRHPAATGYLHELYSNENKTDPIERQALEMVFMQKVDDRAAEALAYLELHEKKPPDPALRDSWSRFLMSLIHRSPERVKYLTQKVQEYENENLNVKLASKYAAMRGPDDPPTYEEWVAEQDPLAPDLRVRLLKLLIDSQRIGNALNMMHWQLYSLEKPRFGFLTGDHPIMMSNGLGHLRGFVLLAISPARLFVAANDPKVIDAFTSQRANALESGLNDAVTRQSRHVIIARDQAQRDFVDRRFLKRTAPLGPDGLYKWKSPLVDLPPL